MDGYRDYLEKFEVGGPQKRIPDETKKQKKKRLLKEKLLAHQKLNEELAKQWNPFQAAQSKVTI